jgi:hypothetical protein
MNELEGDLQTARFRLYEHHVISAEESVRLAEKIYAMFHFEQLTWLQQLWYVMTGIKIKKPKPVGVETNA